RAFHEKCDNKGATVVVAKITNSDQIVGGYNPLFWDSTSKWKSTSNSFIFSFTNRNNLQSAKVGYSNGNEDSVYLDQGCGPWFGMGGNLGLQNNIWHSEYQSQNIVYPKIGIPENF